MKLLCFLYILLVFSFGKNNLLAQNIQLPEKIDLFQYIVPEGTVYDYAHPYNDIYGFPDVRIWGWSNNGKVAYSIERKIEGKGGTIIQFIIFDFVNDKIDFNINIDSNDYNIQEYNENTINDLYNLFKEHIFKAVNKNKIINTRNIFFALPIKINNTEYSCRLETEYKYESEFFERDMVKKYRIIVGKNGKTKIIAERNIVNTETLSVNICGYFISPFEDRILVVTAEEIWGFEGSELYYNFFGCHLGRGFK